MSAPAPPCADILPGGEVHWHRADAGCAWGAVVYLHQEPGEAPEDWRYRVLSHPASMLSITGMQGERVRLRAAQVAEVRS